MPWFILIAGPNGAGKTTLTGSREFLQALDLFPNGSARLINPDEVAKSYFVTHPGTSPSAGDVYAANAVPEAAIACIRRGENVLVETVLSSDKYQRVIGFAHERGYQVGMIYLALESANVSRARVGKRVASGGHPAPFEKLSDRWRRSLERLVKFAPLVNGLLVYLSTSSKGLILLAEKNEGPVFWYGGRKFPELREALNAQDHPRPGTHTGGMPFPPAKERNKKR